MIRRIFEKVLILAVIFCLTLAMFLPLVKSDANSNFTSFKPIYYKSVSQGFSPATSENHDNNGDLLVLSMEYGIKSYGYLAFDLSNFPQDKTPGIAILELESNAVSTKCYVSAYYSTGSDWVNQNITWDTKPVVNALVNSLYISTMRELYDYAGTSFFRSVDQACQQRSTITICLKVGTPTLDQYGLITFLSNAHLDVYYLPESSSAIPTQTPNAIDNSNPTSTPTIPEFPLLVIISLVVVSVMISAVTYKRISIKKQ